jgi:hypothetical protein
MAEKPSKPTKAKPGKAISVKHLQLNKSQSSMLAIVIASIAICVFGLFGIKAMVEKGLYQRKALHARREVVATLKSNLTAANSLIAQYNVFQAQDPNILGGSITGTDNLDGDNARIVLDALPSTYDAPALATSLEKIMTVRGVTITSMKVTDDPTTYPDDPQAHPVSKDIGFSFEGSTNYKGASDLLLDFERSIRAFDVNTLEITGSDESLRISLSMTTYLQSAKSIDLTPTKEVK